jgi:hypothetical protein
MEVKISEIDIGGVLTLPPNWKGYNFNDESNLWVRESDLHKDEKGNLYPFCSVISTNSIEEIFESCPTDENYILIVRGDENSYMNGYILVGNHRLLLNNYKFETKLLFS